MLFYIAFALTGHCAIFFLEYIISDFCAQVMAFHSGPSRTAGVKTTASR